MYNEELLQVVANTLKGIKDARIYYHKTPDGDAIGSSHALALALQSQGIRCELLCEDPVPERYHFLTDVFKADKTENAALISLDSSAPSRLGNYGDLTFDICIDHHEKNTISAQYKYVDETSSSCSEIIYRLIKIMGIQVTKEIVNLLYAGLVTDTSCFRTKSTNANSLYIAAELAKCGADISMVSQTLTMKKSRARIELESILMSNFKYMCDGKVLGCFFTYDDLQRAGTTDAELEGINSVVDQVDGIDIGYVVREKKPGLCRISVRTYGLYDASEICKRFGGGGHADRAGGDMDGGPEEIMAIVESACVKAVEKHHREEEWWKGVRKRAAEFAEAIEKTQNKYFTFIDNDHSAIMNAEKGSRHTVSVKNSQGEELTLVFVIERFMDFPPISLLEVYGRLESPQFDGWKKEWYWGVKISLHKENPEEDTIEISAQAPPIKI